MPTALEIAMDEALSQQTMAICGQTVTYEMLSGTPVEIIMVIDVESLSYPDGGEMQLGEEDITGRVKKTDVSQPTKGDLITDAAGSVFQVRTWMQNPLAAPEWSLVLVRCNA